MLATLLIWITRTSGIKNGFKLKLSYQFEPGDDNDGVTVHIPLPILNQIDQNGFDWQIPGLRQELVISLIKSLPKTLRRNFVPAPNYADAFLARVTPLEAPLLDSLEKELRRMTGVEVVRDDWKLDQITRPLKGNIPSCGSSQAQTERAESWPAWVEREPKRQSSRNTYLKLQMMILSSKDLHTWSFGELPKVYQQKRGGYDVKAYPSTGGYQRQRRDQIVRNRTRADHCNEIGSAPFGSVERTITDQILALEFTEQI